MSQKITIGIDEVGRGPVAGPTCVAAFAMNKNFQSTISLFKKQKKLPLRDSKKLTKLQRELWFKQIKIWQKEGKCNFAVSMVSAKIIDTIGISKAIQKALDNALLSLNFSPTSLILLDGGLKAPFKFKNQKTIIKGDEKEIAISLASIVAKVTRDRHMYRMAKKHPVYNFESHVGYGTRAHYKALEIHGLSPIHRRSFLKNLAI